MLGPDDDITRFEYVKRNNRKTGPALVAVELASREDLDGLLTRLAQSPLLAEQLLPGTPLYGFVS